MILKVLSCLWILFQGNVDSHPIHGELIFPLNSQHNHAPGIAELPDGELLVSWYRGSGERKADDVQVLGSRKPLNGTWSTPFLMADTPEFPDCNTCLFVDQQQRVWMFWPLIIANSWESCLTLAAVSSDYQQEGAPHWSRKDLVLLKPDDFSIEFREKMERFMRESKVQLDEKQRKEVDELLVRLDDKLFQRLGWQPRCKPTELRDGRWLLPLYSDTFSISIMAISDDQGTTWRASRPLIGFGNIQASVIERKDGSLVAYMRENGFTGRVRACESRDRGESWGDVYSTELLNPGSGLDAVALKNGNWVLIYNDTQEGRHRLAVSLSEDEGKSWKWTRHVENEPGRSFHYPAIIQTRDLRIHAVYSYFVPDGKSMKHVVFDESWIRNDQ